MNHLRPITFGIFIMLKVVGRFYFYVPKQVHKKAYNSPAKK